MKLVADANVLFSSIIRKGITARLLLDLRITPCMPEFYFIEFNKHYFLLLAKSGLEKQDFDRAAELLWSRIEVIPDDRLKPFVPAAAALVSDRNDWLYLAAALAENAELWSNDKGFKKQSRVKVWGTEELARELGYLK